MLINDSCGNHDSLWLLHGSPLHIVVDVLGSLQPLSQHGSGVVNIMVCCCPETPTQTTQDVIHMKQTPDHPSHDRTATDSFPPPLESASAKHMRCEQLSPSRNKSLGMSGMSSGMTPSEKIMGCEAGSQIKSNAANRHKLEIATFRQHVMEEEVQASRVV